jgi:TonB family protein
MVPPGAADLRTAAIALAVALMIHSVAAIALLRVDGGWPANNQPPVEIDVNEPPAARPPEPQPEPLRDPVQPKPIRRPKLPHEAPREPPSLVPPPPNQQAAPNAVRNAPPVFGVTMSSVVSGEAAMAVPVGNTTMTKDRRRADLPPQPYPSEGSKPFVPEPEIYIATGAQLLHEVDSEEFYPSRAKTLGIEGTVETMLDIDEKGNVVAVRITKRAGHEFDEAASRALKQFLFKPARASDGRAVPSRLRWRYTFTMKN